MNDSSQLLEFRMSREDYCPVCLQKGGSVLHTFRTREAAQHWVRREADAARHDALREHIRTLWHGDECRVIGCAQCGFCHADPYIAGDARFYELAYNGTAYPARRWEFGVTRDTMTRLVREQQLRDFHLLEIGAGDGAFLKQITPALTTSDRVLATEYSEHGIRAITHLGIECLPVDVRELSAVSYAERFHVVCLFQVLEHMDGLDALFRQLHAITAPNAHVFIAVPNEMKVEFNENNGSLLEMPPNHIGRWTRHGFAIIADRNGWRLAEHRREIEGFRSKAVRHLKFAHARRAQNPRSLANLLERTSSAALRKPGIAAEIAVNAWRTVPALWRLARRRELGDSQWVWLQKVARPASRAVRSDATRSALVTT